MKQVIRIGVLCAAVAALAVGSAGIAGAGNGVEQGNVVITPNPVALGGTVTISNAADEDSTCEPDDGDPSVSVIISNDVYEEEITTTPDNDGNWSVSFTVPNAQDALGEWDVDAICWYGENDIEATPLAFPPFYYPLANFTVVDAMVPDSGAEPAEEVRTAPRFTG